MTDIITELRTWLLRARHDAASTEDALESAIAIYQGAAGAITALQAVQADAKLLLGEIMIETGETNVSTKAGRCYVTSASRVVTYDAKGIDALAAKIEDKKLEAIGLHNYLDENRDYIHPSKVTTKFDPFLGELEDILACNVVSDEQLANVEAWIGRALTFKQGIDNKRRQAPRQTERIAA